jgi:hypothetical protein
MKEVKISLKTPLYTHFNLTGDILRLPLDGVLSKSIVRKYYREP